MEILTEMIENAGKLAASQGDRLAEKRSKELDAPVHANGDDIRGWWRRGKLHDLACPKNLRIGQEAIIARLYMGARRANTDLKVKIDESQRLDTALSRTRTVQERFDHLIELITELDDDAAQGRRRQAPRRGECGARRRARAARRARRQRPAAHVAP